MKIHNGEYGNFYIDECIELYEGYGEATTCHGDELGISFPEECED